MASSKETYCLCGQPYNIGQFMIECDCCREWFHGSCVDVKIYHSDDIDKYHCPKCAQTYGPSVLKIPTNDHRSDRYELGAESRPAQVGSPAWVRALAARPLRPAPAALQRLRGHQFTEEFIKDNGFTRPVIFHTPEGLDIKVPNPATFTVRSVLRFCGAQLEVEVIDVRKQSTMRMPLGDFIDYFESPPEHRDEKVLNVLSLEFSETNLTPLVAPPRTARSLDWAERVWPPAERPPKPCVQKYCLMSAAGSFTDFHIDFGGTSVWYHVLHGRKIFYLIPPTSANLALYQQWTPNNQQNERFFGDAVEWYGTAEVCPGETLFIPAGWIHAVLTPCDSLVFGGNFLHSYAVEMQLQVYSLESGGAVEGAGVGAAGRGPEGERRAETPAALRYPLFEQMHWYAAAHFLALLRRHNEESMDEEFTPSEVGWSGGGGGAAPGAPPPALLLRGARVLTAAIKEWHSMKATDAAKRDNVPKCLNSGQLVRELSKELRTLEKRTISNNKDKDFKPKTNSPNKNTKKQQSQKKSIKLTLPKPIMHMGQNGEITEEKVYADKFYVGNKEVVFEERYVTDVKYNGLTETKYIIENKDIPENYNYQKFEEHSYHDNGYVDRIDKKIVKVKMSNSPSSSQEAPPPYSLPEHSILKSHLIRSDRSSLKPLQQWTISKKDIGDYHEEQLLFTNENLQTNIRIEGQDLNYGPGMYSAEDIQQDYQYSEGAKPGSYQPEFAYQAELPYATEYHRYDDTVAVPVQTATYTVPAGQVVAYQTTTPLPSYDAAIAHHYAATTYVTEAPKTEVPATDTPSVRRSERAVRRRISSTYDYEDGDLFIDDAPAPRRRKPPAKHRQPPHAQAVSSSGYRGGGGGGGARPAPANGIESLIQASVLAEEPAHATEDAAVAGMLSISERYAAPARTFGLASDSPHAAAPAAPAAPASRLDSMPVAGSKRVRKPTAVSTEEEFPDEEDVIKEVHRDEEYVYPSLEMSSDEEEEWSCARRRHSRSRNDSKTRTDKDEAWSPRARVGRVAPRSRGPARPAVRRECVRAALLAAAHRHPHNHPPPQNAKRAVLACKSRRPPAPAQPPAKTKAADIRLKKGMKTAKQRLGKILKLHKMIY
ncbi:PREDICTED: lysine-specific demethylase phf2-like isoform X3 [Papilio polytes]|uniref:lysine-specific demethylase phf2-like isoform X3 n=1 Tax=Papilio polytes TaxID=76194 RepID=UPI000675E22B|nr:PREDICTED: lysine-specific demethylase phf2-like isoform X3 [Papilio polytes]